jgi:beta-lactamase regulating signal transducer with metallopeptidase domain
VTHLLGNRYAVFAGWMLLVALWETTAFAVLLAGVRLSMQRLSAKRQYAVACSAFFAAVTLALVIPLAIAARNHSTTQPPSGPGVSVASQRLRSSPIPAPDGTLTSTASLREVLQGSQIDAFVAMVATAWAAGVVALLIRLAGGWWMARSLIKTAHPVEDAIRQRTAEGIAAAAGVSRSVTLLESADVEAPVVLGWRRPALILPHAALPRLAPEQMSALLLHEFAHIRRGDYLVNILQSVAEAPFFFSPAMTWMSRRIREAREFCCDDEAVAGVGDRRQYVEALTTLAALATINEGRSSVGISGPRLITRVRRLLQEESMPRLRFLRLAALAGALGVVIGTGLQVSAASALRVPRQAPTASPAKVPYGYATEQRGSGVLLKELRADVGAPASGATVQNISTEKIVGLRFVAAVERRGGTGWVQVQLFTSDEIPMDLAPGQVADVAPSVLTQERLDDLQREPTINRIQYFVGLQSVRFANGFTWRMVSNPSATSGSEAIVGPREPLPRSLIARDANKTPISYGACKDDEGRTTSHGGAFDMLNEPGHTIRCEDGRWVEGRIPSTPRR